MIIKILDKWFQSFQIQISNLNQQLCEFKYKKYHKSTRTILKSLFNLSVSSSQTIGFVIIVSNILQEMQDHQCCQLLPCVCKNIRLIKIAHQIYFRKINNINVLYANPIWQNSRVKRISCHLKICQIDCGIIIDRTRKCKLYKLMILNYYSQASNRRVDYTEDILPSQKDEEEFEFVGQSKEFIKEEDLIKQALGIINKPQHYNKKPTKQQENKDRDQKD